MVNTKKQSYMEVLKMKLELKMDNKTFWFCIAIIFLIGLLALGWNDTPIIVERYNCSCPKEESSFFKDGGWEVITNDDIVDNIVIPDFEDCEEVTCDCYEEFGCMAKCYRCPEST
ncbi:hypothetical protein LCGC14_1783240 [marine sediment metagenome]|uniref:Transmembrane protein n=1 Tax=marine sediment metagenome TaxID=412755 RepID=A0A0F9HHC2_9ZZZZ